MKYARASLAYANDLAIMTSDHRHIPTQAEKVDRHCTWSNLEVNHGKCAISGMCYGDAHVGLATCASDKGYLKPRLENAFKI